MLSQLLALDPALRCYWPDSARYKTQLRNFASHASRCVNAQPLLSERFPARFVFLHLTSGEEPMALEANETGNLIGSDKVEGTAVYGADHNKIGSIERVMIDKKSGRVSYAVLSFGGFLGIGDDHYPLPWQSLKYDTSLGGYVTGVTEAQLKGAPHYRNDNTWNWSDPTRTRAVNDYYGVAI